MRVGRSGLLACAVLIFAPCVLRAQTCSQLLSLVEDQYEAGDLLSIPEEMERCFRHTSGGFTRDESIRAYRLVILSYIFTDNVSASEASMEALLRTDPEHVFSEATDPKEVFYLHSKFRTTPIYRLRVYLLGNYSVVNFLQSYGVENTTKASERATGRILGGAGIAAEKEFFPFLELLVGVQAAARSFSLRNDLYDYSYHELTETQFWLDMPLGARFFLSPQKKHRVFQPYLQMGWMPSWLLSSSLTGIRQGGGVVNLGSLDLLSERKRNPFMHSLFLGAGLRYRLKNKRNFLLFDVSYVRGNTNLVRQRNRYLGNQDLHFRLGYVDNNFSLDAVEVSLGFIFSVYNPKKLRKYREE